MTLKNDPETSRCYGDWIRGYVDRLWMTLKNDAETVRYKGDLFRGDVSISVSMALNVMLEHPDIREIGLEDVYQ